MPLPPACLAGGGEMGALMRSYDWASSDLGPPAAWPLPLQTVVQIMLNTGHPIYIFWGETGSCLYNDAYSQSLGPERHPGSLGRPAAEVWSEIWPIIGPDIEQVMAGRGTTWHENNLVPITRNGHAEDVYWTYSYSPIGDADAPNGVGGVLVICNETTSQVIAKQQLAAAARRQQQIFQSAPGFITVLSGPQHVFEFVNTAYSDIFGPRDFIGRSVQDVFPELKGQGFLELLDKVYQTGEKITAEASPLLLQDQGDTVLRETFVTFIYAPIIDEFGSVTGIFCEGMDVTAQQKSEKLRRLLTHELQHRIKNMMAVVHAVVGQSLRNAETVEDARRAISMRLVTLAHAHDLLTESSWVDAPLMAIIEGAVIAHYSESDRVSINGPAVELQARAALALSMALHELGTNAVKYGALSNEVGTVDISWSISDTDTLDPEFHIVWQESGGPHVAPPRQLGFGSRLTGTILKADLGSPGETVYAPDGVRWELHTRLSEICTSPTIRTAAAA